MAEHAYGVGLSLRNARCEILCLELADLQKRAVCLEANVRAYERNDILNRAAYDNEEVVESDPFVAGNGNKAATYKRFWDLTKMTRITRGSMPRQGRCVV